MAFVAGESERDPTSTEGKTPPQGTELQSLLADATREEPEQKTSVYSSAEQSLVARTVPATQLPWSGGLQPHARLSQYELLERLHRGESAELYVARARDGRRVALKVTLPEYQHTELFLEDARSVSALRHAGLLPVLDAGQAQGRSFVAMEYVYGRDAATLARCMAESGGASRPFALTVTLQLARALEAMHRQGVTHGAVNASHVMVSDAGEVKLCLRSGRGDDVQSALGVLRELLGGAATGFEGRRFANPGELAAALAAELQREKPVDAAMMVRALCGRSLASEKRRVEEAASAAAPQKAQVPPPRRSGATRVALVLTLLAGLGALALFLLGR